MLFSDEKRTIKKYKAKESVDQLAKKLVPILYPFTECTPDDVIEKLVVVAAASYGLLDKEDIQKLANAGIIKIPQTNQTQQQSENVHVLPLGQLKRKEA